MADTTFAAYAHIIEFAQLQSNLRRPVRPSRSGLDMARKAAKYGHRQIVARFDRMIAPDGTPWVPTKEVSMRIFEAKYGYPHTGITGKATQELYRAIKSVGFISVRRTSNGFRIVFGANITGRLAERAAHFSTTHEAVVFGTPTGRMVPGRPFMGLTEKEEQKMSEMMSAERIKLRKELARLRNKNTTSKSRIVFFAYP
jgi:phage gpG-like protein